jgi:ankyrin repeat protein
MEALLQAGANPRARNDLGQTPMDIARSRDEKDKIELLQSHSK